MGTIILYCVLGSLGLFILYMLVITSSLGTERFKVPQFLMSSLTYSEEATTKLNLLMDKYEAGLLNIRRTDKTLIFTDAETGQKAGEIWIQNKYYSYGNLHRYGANDDKQWSCNKPNIKTFKRIIKLEQTLEKTAQEQSAVNTPKPAAKAGEEVVLD